MFKNFIEGLKILFIQGYFAERIQDGHRRMEESSLRFYRGMWSEWRRECEQMTPRTEEERRLIERFLSMPCDDEDDFNALLSVRREIQTLKGERET